MEKVDEFDNITPEELAEGAFVQVILIIHDLTYLISLWGCRTTGECSPIRRAVVRAEPLGRAQVVPTCTC